MPGHGQPLHKEEREGQVNTQHDTLLGWNRKIKSNWCIHGLKEQDPFNNI